MFELRWFCVCDENGQKTEDVLQFRNNEDEPWSLIPYVEKKDHEITEDDGVD